MLNMWRHRVKQVILSKNWHWPESSVLVRGRTLKYGETRGGPESWGKESGEEVRIRRGRLQPLCAQSGQNSTLRCWYLNCLQECKGWFFFPYASTVLNALHIVSHLIFTTPLQGRNYYYPHFTDGVTEAQKG